MFWKPSRASSMASTQVRSTVFSTLRLENWNSLSALEMLSIKNR